jgi:lantibiotic modifying enzyme
MNFPEKLQSYRKKSKPLNDTVFQSVYRHYDEIIKKFLDSQKLWLSQIAPEIMNDIQTFLSQHVEELKTLDMEI